MNWGTPKSWHEERAEKEKRCSRKLKYMQALKGNQSLVGKPCTQPVLEAIMALTCWKINGGRWGPDIKGRDRWDLQKIGRSWEEGRFSQGWTGIPADSKVLGQRGEQQHQLWEEENREKEVKRSAQPRVSRRMKMQFETTDLQANNKKGLFTQS